MNSPLVSIVIDNYNYERFLGAAIDSTLGQTYAEIEVIVADDGSTDGSRDIIARYGDRITPVLRPNGGHAQAFNSGFAASRGDIVVFLDSDDALLPDAATNFCPLFENPEVSKVHWPMWVIDADGDRTGERYPRAPLPKGDFRERLVDTGPTTLLSPPTSGNAWARSLLERFMPIPEALYRMGAEKFLIEVAPFAGIIETLPEPQSLYRRHGGNSKLQHTIDDFVERELAFYDHYSSVLIEYCKTQGRDVDAAVWKRNSWWHRQARALEEIAALPNREAAVIFVDDAIWGLGPLAGRRRFPFLEHDGEYWGSPVDDEQAVREMERLRTAGAAYIIFAWHALWWLSSYPEFHAYLKSKYPCVLENERLLVFDLRAAA